MHDRLINKIYLSLKNALAKVLVSLIEQIIQLIPLWILIIVNFIVGIKISTIEFVMSNYSYLVVATLAEFFYYRTNNVPKYKLAKYFYVITALVSLVIYVSIFIKRILNDNYVINEFLCLKISIVLLFLYSLTSMALKVFNKEN